MKSIKQLPYFILIVLLNYLLFALVNWSWVTLNWTSTSKVCFIGVTLVAVAKLLFNNKEKYYLDRNA